MNEQTERYTEPPTPTKHHAGWWLHLKPEPSTDADEPERRLRAALKRLLRSHRLRCTAIRMPEQDAARGDSAAMERGA